MKRCFATIILITFAFLSVSAMAEDGWQTIRHFEQVSTFKLKRVLYEPPLLFEWGKPVDMSGNNGTLPEWHDLMKTSTVWSDLSFEEYRSLVTEDCWPTLEVNESKFVEYKKKREKFPELYPTMRYELIYAKVYVNIGGEEFMFLSRARGSDVIEAMAVVKERMKPNNKTHAAIFLKLEDGKWKHHAITLELDRFPVLKKIPLSNSVVSDIIKSGKTYFDPVIHSVNLESLDIAKPDVEDILDP